MLNEMLPQRFRMYYDYKRAQHATANRVISQSLKHFWKYKKKKKVSFGCSYGEVQPHVAWKKQVSVLVKAGSK